MGVEVTPRLGQARPGESDVRRGELALTRVVGKRRQIGTLGTYQIHGTRNRGASVRHPRRLGQLVHAIIPEK